MITERDALDPMEETELDIVVPHATNFSLEDLEAHVSPHLGEQDDAKQSQLLSALASIPPRTILYFDELLNVFMVLRTPSRLEEIQRQLPQLKISLEVQAFGSEKRGSHAQVNGGQLAEAINREIIWSGSLDTSRPRARMQQPMITFKASGTLRQPPSTTIEHPEDRLLPSGVAASINILEPLTGDQELRGIRPQLTASRLDRINTTTSPATTVQIIRSKQQKPFPALPAVSARVRYSKSGGSSGRSATIANLDIETSPFQKEEIQLMDVSMELSDGSVEDLCTGRVIKLPMACQPRSNLVFLLRLLPSNHQVNGSRLSSIPRNLDICVNARVLISKTCRPHIQMRWRTTVDFLAALNPNYGGPSQPMQRSNRPSSLPIRSGNEKHGNTSTALDIAPASSEDSQQQAMATAGFGVTLTLTAPKEVYVGQPFTWDVFVVNRSDQARKLAIVVIPKRKAADHKIHLSKTSVSSNAVNQRRGIDHADAVMDENRLYAMQKSNGKDAVQIVCLSTDVRIGNLNPGFCHNTELKFLPLSKGILNVEAVRVIDVLTNESIDIRDLPEIVAEERVSDDKE
ncbi:MAG: hypothetical protein Q9223_004341 [Gallowayella weberi]